MSRPRRSSPSESLLAALVVVLSATLFVDVVEHAPILEWTRRATWEWLTRGLDGDASDVVVVDISSIGRPANDMGQPITDREELRHVVQALCEAGARGVAIDIDFSPELGAPVHEDDPALLEWLSQLEAEDGHPIHVHVGAHRTLASRPGDRLGQAAVSHLAAALVADTSDNRLMPLSVSWHGAEPMSTLGAASAMALLPGKALPERAYAPGVANCTREHAIGSVELQSLYVDYSTLDDLIERRLPTAARGETLQPGRLSMELTRDIESHPELVRGKLAVVGYANPQSMADNSFVAPGESRALPGVYAHAAVAAMLLGDGYLYAPSRLFEKVLDVGLALLLLTSVAVCRRRILSHHGEAEELSLHLLLVAALIAATWLLLGPLFVTWFRIVPDGLPIVSLALVAELLWEPTLVLYRSIRSK